MALKKPDPKATPKAAKEAVVVEETPVVVVSEPEQEVVVEAPAATEVPEQEVVVEAPAATEVPEQEVVVEAPAATEEPEQEGVVEAPVVPAEPEVVVATDDLRMAKVKNNGKSFLYQGSTGIYIQSGEIKALQDDSWLKLQERVGLLERV